MSVKLKCVNIGKVYYTRDGEIKALNEVNFEIKEREFLCILGPSGCGKTTLLKIIAGLLPSTGGEITYGGSISNNYSCAMVFQEHGLFPWMRVLDNVAFGLEVKRIPRKERQKISLRFLERLGLLRFARNYPHELSLGMQQRVGVARAFATGSEVLLMDEPFGSLDAQTKLIAQGELLRIWQGDQKSVIYVTHDINEAILLGDRILVMSRSPGRVKEEIPIILSRPRRIEIEDTPEFTRIKRRIWSSLKEEILVEERKSL